MSKKQIDHNSFTAEEQLRYALAYEANAAAYAVALTEAAGGQTWREPDFTLTLFPFTHSISGVFLPRFTEESFGERIKMILEIARQQRKKILFRLGPAPQPVDLAYRLVQMGIRKSLTQKYMAIPLTDDSPVLSRADQPTGLAGLRIYPVDDYGILSQMPHPRMGAINSAKKRCLVQAYQKLAEQTPRRHWMFLAELDGKLIASVGLFLHQDSVAGYDLLVLPEYRRQGIGSAMLQPDRTIYQRAGGVAGGVGIQRAGDAILSTTGDGAHIGAYPIYSYSP